MSRSLRWMVAIIVVMLVLTPAMIYEAGPHPHKLHTMVEGNAGSYIASGVPFYVEKIASGCNTNFLYIQFNTSGRSISSTFPLEFEIRIIGVSEYGNIVMFLSLYLTSIRYHNTSISLSFVYESSQGGTELIYHYQTSGSGENISSLSNACFDGKLGIYNQFGPFFELQQCVPLNY